jgi:hypothetical protein
MNLFECEVCGSKEPTDHEELVAHILEMHIDYTETEADYFAKLWEEDKINAQESEIYSWEEDTSDRDPLE